MAKLRKLTEQERESIKTRAQEIIFDDCRQDDGYLRSVVDDWVESLDIEGRLDAICNDPDMLPEILGFNPYKED